MFKPTDIRTVFQVLRGVFSKSELFEPRSSFLDVPGLLSIAEGLKVNRTLETLKVNGLKSLLKGVGASVEEAFAKTLETNTTLTRLGLNLQNPHWRDMIDRRLMQNADKRRKTRLANRQSSKDGVLGNSLEVPKKLA